MLTDWVSLAWLNVACFFSVCVQGSWTICQWWFWGPRYGEEYCWPAQQSLWCISHSLPRARRCQEATEAKGSAKTIPVEPWNVKHSSRAVIIPGNITEILLLQTEYYERYTLKLQQQIEDQNQQISRLQAELISATNHASGWWSNQNKWGGKNK